MKDGGPAFPGQPRIIHPQVGETVVEQGGMSLRDWFAGKALQGYCSQPSHAISWSDEEIAKEAYATADAMLLEREKQP